MSSSVEGDRDSRPCFIDDVLGLALAGKRMTNSITRPGRLETMRIKDILEMQLLQGTPRMIARAPMPHCSSRFADESIPSVGTQPILQK
jgi:hypothetical protein